MPRLVFIPISALVGLVLVACSASPASQVAEPVAQSEQSTAPANAQAAPAAALVEPEPEPSPHVAAAVSTAPEAAPTAALAVAMMAPAAGTSADSTVEGEEVDCSATENRCNPACAAGTGQSRMFVPSPDDVAYEFALPSAAGQEYTLSSFHGERNLLLVFYRAFWCEFCREQLMEISEHYSEIQDMDTEVLADRTDDLTDSHDIVDAIGIPFPVLYDPKVTTVADYGIFNLLGDGLSTSSTFIIDKQGIIRWVYAAEAIDDQAPVSEILRQIALVEG